jgi:hypothetical protein
MRRERACAGVRGDQAEEREEATEGEVLERDGA